MKEFIVRLFREILQYSSFPRKLTLQITPLVSIFNFFLWMTIRGDWSIALSVILEDLTSIYIEKRKGRFIYGALFRII